MPDARSFVLGPHQLPGVLRVPLGPQGLVVFAHGSGSSHRSPRNNQVAEALGTAGFATILFDLLTHDEERDRRNVFDISLLADRLVDALQRVHALAELAGLPIGLFGASTGAAAALVAASRSPDMVRAVVSRGGRPDLAGGVALQRVRAPTLLIVGGADTEVIGLNRAAAGFMQCPHELHIVPGAGHLFEEPGAMQQVIDQAAAWFGRYLVAGTRTGTGQ